MSRWAGTAYWRHELAHLWYCPVEYFWSGHCWHIHGMPMTWLQHLCDRYEKGWVDE